MIKLVVNADDFGHDRNRTEAIRACFRNGLLTQTTAMVNMKYCAQAIEDARRDGIDDRVGLHLNLTFGFPLTCAIRSCRTFCAEDGYFTGYFHRSRFKRFFLTNVEKLVVEKEIRAQMERYLAFGLPLMHLDSHHHAHTDPAILRLVLPLAREYGFKTIRISRNVPMQMGFAKWIYKRLVNRMIFTSGIGHADYFGAALDVERELGRLSTDGTVEIMTHPIFVRGDKMPLNHEYDEVDGKLCDTFTPIETIIAAVDRIRV